MTNQIHERKSWKASWERWHLKVREGWEQKSIHYRKRARAWQGFGSTVSSGNDILTLLPLLSPCTYSSALIRIHESFQRQWTLTCWGAFALGELPPLSISSRPISETQHKSHLFHEYFHVPPIGLIACLSVYTIKWHFYTTWYLEISSFFREICFITMW